MTQFADLRVPPHLLVGVGYTLQPNTATPESWPLFLYPLLADALEVIADTKKASGDEENKDDARTRGNHYQLSSTQSCKKMTKSRKLFKVFITTYTFTKSWRCDLDLDDHR